MPKWPSLRHHHFYYALLWQKDLGGQLSKEAVRQEQVWTVGEAIERQVRPKPGHASKSETAMNLVVRQQLHNASNYIIIWGQNSNLN